MNCARLFLFAVLLRLWHRAAQTDQVPRRLSDFQVRMRHGQPGNRGDAAFIKEFNERQRIEFPKAYPPRESTGMTPLNELGKIAHMLLDFLRKDAQPWCSAL